MIFKNTSYLQKCHFKCKQTKTSIITNYQKTTIPKSFKTKSSIIPKLNLTKSKLIPEEEAIKKWIKSIFFGSLIGISILIGGGYIPDNYNSALADLNKYEADIGGEFGIGTAQQYGEADLKGRDFSNQDLTRSNFTAADCRDVNFKDSRLIGAYFIKSVLYHANLENTDLSDALMDRAVLVEANLKNAILQRVVLTRSDLNNAIIEGADFSNSLVDRSQQLNLCRYANGVNPVTGISTRSSLGCSSKRQFRAQAPSNVTGPGVSDESKEKFTKTLPTYGN